MPVFSGAIGALILVGGIAAILACVAGLALAGRKAGLEGMSWFTLIRMAGLERWRIPWYALPLGPALLCRVPFGIAQRFGKNWLFGLGLLLLPFVFLPILGFGSARYSPVAMAEKHDRI